MKHDWPEDWIPLLSGKPLCDYTPEDFKAYVRGLFKLRAKKEPRVKKRLKVSVRRLKKGRLSVTTKRSPPYVTKEEYAALCTEHPENELFIALKEKGVLIYEDHHEADRIAKEIAELPWR